jgi:hypothetical protein
MVVGPLRPVVADHAHVVCQCVTVRSNETTFPVRTGVLEMVEAESGSAFVMFFKQLPWFENNASFL